MTDLGLGIGWEMVIRWKLDLWTPATGFFKNQFNKPLSAHSVRALVTGTAGGFSGSDFWLLWLCCRWGHHVLRLVKRCWSASPLQNLSCPWSSLNLTGLSRHSPCPAGALQSLWGGVSESLGEGAFSGPYQGVYNKSQDFSFFLKSHILSVVTNYVTYSLK